MSRRVAIIVAMERERWPIVRHLPEQENRGACVLLKGNCRMGLPDTAEGIRYEDIVVVTAGIGRKPVAAATRAIVDNFAPEYLVSAGLAGALTTAHIAGDVLRPAVVVDANSGARHETVHDPRAVGVLVTASSVLTREEKKQIADKFGAEAVDMEAAVVAEIARAAAVPFIAMKAISDPVAFEMPPMDRFIDATGRLNLLKLIGYAAFRPRTWRSLGQLRKNSGLATEALGKQMGELLRALQAHEPHEVH